LAEILWHFSICSSQRLALKSVKVTDSAKVKQIYTDFAFNSDLDIDKRWIIGARIITFSSKLN